MTQSFPLSLSAFALQLRIKNFAWKLVDQQEISGLGTGEILVADLAPKYWQSKVVLDAMPHAEASRVQALIESLDGAIGTAYFHDPRTPYPAYDPDGSILGSDEVKVLEVRNNNKEFKLKNLQVGYQLRRGDFFAFDFGSDPVHRALHRIVSASETAGEDKTTDWIEFRPHLIVAPPVNTIVTLKRPAAEVKIVPKSFNEGQPAGTLNTGMSFDIRQVL